MSSSRLILLLFALFLSFQAAGAEDDSSECESSISESAKSKNLEKLEEFLNKNPDFARFDGKVGARHSVERVDGRVVLKLGYLEKSYHQYMRLVYAAILEGSIDEVDAQVIIGPKAVVLFQRMTELKPRHNKVVTYRTLLNIRTLMNTMQKQADESELRRAGDPKKWSAEDIADFYATVEKLQFEKGCQQIYGTTDFSNCKSMNLTIRSDSPSEVIWD